MKISKTILSLRNEITLWRKQGLTIAFVPTMGHLHAGHIELVNAARKKCDKVVVSIFVNPLQFNETADFSAYPKTLVQDQDKLTDAQTDMLYLPDVEEMYPVSQESITKVIVPEIGSELEGAFRPGHFDGVSTVVLKLFNQVMPDIAFFGEKDFQQLLLVKKMVNDLNVSIEIQSVATQREADGLAMSSRNTRLTPAQRAIAPELFGVLNELAEQLKKGDADIKMLEGQALKRLKLAGFEPEYISVRNALNLLPADDNTGHRVVLGAARLGEVRLIDNLSIDQVAPVR